MRNQQLRWTQVLWYTMMGTLLMVLGMVLVELNVVRWSGREARNVATFGVQSGSETAASSTDWTAHAAIREQISILRAELTRSVKPPPSNSSPVQVAPAVAPVSQGSQQPAEEEEDESDKVDYSKFQRVVHVVSHTHWDREWYMAFENYRRRFVWLLDDVMDRMRREQGFRHFHMDGQVVPFVDYFEVKPHRRAEVLQAVKDGKLSIGPWYTAPDEFLASPEALVRNRQDGLRHARRFGVESQWYRVGYMADTFGHVSQIPQIYRLFGIDNAVFARGVNHPSAEMWWTGPDGSRVFSVYMTNWYCNAEGSPGGSAGAGWLASKADATAQRGSTKHVLLMSGCDHTSFDPNILSAISQANAAGSSKAVYLHSSLRHYVRQARSAVGGSNIRTVSGELRAEIGGLSHINSNKITQKQANWECETLLEHYAEPMRAMLWARGALGDYQSDYIWYAWEKVLENHAHDSIGGCSVPEVHSDVDHRFYRCAQVGRQLVDEALMALSDHADASGGGQARVAAFNTLGFRRSHETLVVRLNADCQAGQAARVVDAATNEPVPAETLISEGGMWDYALPNYGWRQGMHVSRCWLAINTGAAGIPPLGHKVYRVESLSGAGQVESGGGSGVPSGGLAVLENANLVRVVIGNDATATLTDLKTSKTYEGLGRLVYQQDRGDEYKSQPAGGDTSPSSSDTRLVGCRRGPAVQRCTVQTSVAGMSVTIVYALPAGSTQLEIGVSLMNSKADFRLRAHFPVPGALRSEADSHFDVVVRDLASPGEERAQQDFVTLRSGDGGLTVSNRGLPGYEIVGNAVAVTLLRATSRMSDWANFPTAPSSLELGARHFELAVAPFRGPAAPEDRGAYIPSSHEMAHAFNVPPASVHVLNYPGVMNSKPLFEPRHTLLLLEEMSTAGNTPQAPHFPPNPSGSGGGYSISYHGSPFSPSLGAAGSTLSVEPSGLLTVTSVKVSEPHTFDKADGGTLIVRWFAHGDATVLAVVCFPGLGSSVREAYLVNLREDRQEQLKIVDGGCLAPIPTGSRQIRTVELVVSRPQQTS